MSKELSFDAEYVAARQEGLLDEIAEDDANFGRLVMFGILELAKQSLRATGPAPKVDLTVKVTVAPFQTAGTSTETEECSEVTINLGIVVIKKSRHKKHTTGTTK